MLKLKYFYIYYKSETGKSNKFYINIIINYITIEFINLMKDKGLV